jgi:type IV secretory pathway VirB10-like protein
LGSSSDVAQWVKAACGTRLADRRRKLAGIPKSDATITSSTSTVPKLWHNQDGTGNTSASSSGSDSRPDHTIQADFRAASSSFAGRALNARRGIAIGAMVAVVLAITVVLILNKTAQPERAESLRAPSSAAAPAAVATPAQIPDKPVVTPPVTPLPTAPSTDAPASPTLKPASPVTAHPAVADRARPRVAAPVAKGHKPSTSSAAIVNSARDSLAELRKDAAIAAPIEMRAPAPAAPAQAAPARSPSRLDANPYLLGE